jgi:hypothetical protein
VTESRLEKKSGPVGKTDPQRKEVIWSFSFVDKTVARFSIRERRESEFMMKQSRDTALGAIRQKVPNNRKKLRGYQVTQYLRRDAAMPEDKVRAYISEAFARAFSDELKHAGLDPESEAVDQRLAIGDLFDKFVLSQAELMGTDVLEVNFVRMRISDWRHNGNGADMHEKLGKALAKSVRILRKEDRPPLSPHEKEFKKQTVNELQTLLRLLAGEFRHLRQRPATKSVLDKFRAIVGCADYKLNHIAANIDSWAEYVAAEPKEIMHQVYDKTRFKPATLFNRWRAWGTGFSEGTIRDLISRQPVESTSK